MGKSQCGVSWYPEDLLVNEQNGVASGNYELLRNIKVVFSYLPYVNLHFIMLMLFFFFDLAYDLSIDV